MTATVASPRPSRLKSEMSHAAGPPQRVQKGPGATGIFPIYAPVAKKIANFFKVLEYKPAHIYVEEHPCRYHRCYEEGPAVAYKWQGHADDGQQSHDHAEVNGYLPENKERKPRARIRGP